MAKGKKSVRADELLGLLSARHVRDLFFPEVKDGPTWSGSHLRLDALAIMKSWSPIRLIGYEIKVDRSDWLGDRKWEAYLDLVHEFWIVAPPEVVPVEEVPAGVGVLRPSSELTMLRTERKAVRRPIDLPGELLLYLLMSRTRIGNPREPEPQTRAERIEWWKAQLERDKEGEIVGLHVHERMRARLKAAESGVRTYAIDEQRELEQWLAENGADAWGTLLKRVTSVISNRLSEIDHARTNLERSVLRCVRVLARRHPKRIRIEAVE